MLGAAVRGAHWEIDLSVVDEYDLLSGMITTTPSRSLSLLAVDDYARQQEGETAGEQGLRISRSERRSTTAFQIEIERLIAHRPLLGFARFEDVVDQAIFVAVLPEIEDWALRPWCSVANRNCPRTAVVFPIPLPFGVKTVIFP